MTNIPPFSPGCFGSALAYSDELRVCIDCPFRETCKPVHEENRLALLEKLGGYRMKRWSRKTARAAKPKPQPTPAPVAKAAPNKAVLALTGRVEALVERLDREDYQVVKKLQAGQNPFNAKDNFLRVACHLLLRGATLTRPLLQVAFAHKLGVKDSVATLRAAETLKVLHHLGAITHTEGAFTLRKN